MKRILLLLSILPFFAFAQQNTLPGGATTIPSPTQYKYGTGATSRLYDYTGGWYYPKLTFQDTTSLLLTQHNGDIRYAKLTGATFTGPVILNTDPIAAMGAATKNYVDNIATGIYWKAAVKAATTANITLSGPQTIDGVSVVAGDRVLVKNQTSGTDNGIYIVSISAWSRSGDANTGLLILASAMYVQSGGTINGGTQWANNNTTTPTIGTTPITYGQLAGAGVYTNGSGLNLTGNVFSLNTSYTRGLFSFAAGSGAYNSSTGQITIPTDNSQIANGAGYLTPSSGSGLYQPLENQRLSTTNSPTFAAATVTGIISANNFISGWTSAATGSNYTLTSTSTDRWYLTGGGNTTITLPNTSTLSVGRKFSIVRDGSTSGTVTINASDGSLVQTLLPTAGASVTVVTTGVTTNAAWLVESITKPSSLVFQDATTPSLVWQWYSTGNKARLNNSTNGDVTTVDVGGVFTSAAFVTSGGGGYIGVTNRANSGQVWQINADNTGLHYYLGGNVGTISTAGNWLFGSGTTDNGVDRVQISGSLNISGLTASKVVFTNASKSLTSTGIGTSSQFIMGDGSLNSNTYLPTSAISGTTYDYGYFSGTNTISSNGFAKIAINGSYKTIGFGIGVAGINDLSTDHPHMVEINNDNGTQQVLKITTAGIGSYSQNNMHWDTFDGTFASPTNTKSGMFFMSMGYRGFDPTNGISQSAAAYQAWATADWTSSSHPILFNWAVTDVGSLTRVNAFQVRQNADLWGAKNMVLGMPDKSPWNAAYTTLTVGNGVFRGQVTVNNIGLFNGVYYDTGWKYVNNNSGSYLNLDDTGNLIYSVTTDASPSAGGTANLISPFIISKAGRATITDGSQGLILGPYNSGYGAIWSSTITPSIGNYSLSTNGINTFINGSTSTALLANGSTVLAATSTGIAVTGGISTNVAVNPNSPQTTINGTTSGSITCSQPFAGSSYKKVIISINGLSSTTLTYTYPIAFSLNPVQNFSYTGTVTITSDATHATISGTSGTGWVVLEGY